MRKHFDFNHLYYYTIKKGKITIFSFKIMATKTKSMLGKLFGSNARVNILKHFLSQPEKAFYIRQISRDLKLQLNSVRRELENLEKFGLLKIVKKDSTIQNKNQTRENKNTNKNDNSSSKLDKKYYQVNTDFVLYEEIRTLLIKAQVLYERDFVEKLSSVGNAKLLILTGFFVNNTDSPIDLLLVGRINKNKFIQLLKRLENELGREVNYTVMGLKEFKYRRDITDVFLYSLLENKKIVVIDKFGLT